jgi:hypothetical protein
MAKKKRSPTPSARGRRRSKKKPVKGKRAKTKLTTGSRQEEFDRIWDENFAHARELSESDGPMWWYRMSGREQQFGRWLMTQRYNRRIGGLRRDRERRLEQIGLAWEIEPAVWEWRFGQIEALVEREGELWWRALESRSMELECWLRMQINRYFDGTLSAERIARFETIGMRWDRTYEYWDVRLEQLRGFLRDHPNSRITEENAGHELATWAQSQRAAREMGTLARDRVRRLKEIGFEWSGRKAKSEDIWYRRLAELSAYAKKKGDPYPPSRGSAVARSLRQWLQRQQSRWERLPREKKAALVALGVEQTTPQPERKLDAGTPAAKRAPKGKPKPGKPKRPGGPDWAGFFAAAAAFKKHHGHLAILPNDDARAFPGLAQFASKVRSGAIKCTAGQGARLDALGFDWQPLPDRAWAFFDERMAELRAYKKEHGDCNVPLVQYRPGRKQSPEIKKHPLLQLGQWVQRMRRKQEQLHPEQGRQLDEIGLVWDRKSQWIDSAWRARLDELCAYKKEYGDCLVPQKSRAFKSLGTWVSRIRREKDTLSSGQVRELDEIGFVWHARNAEKRAIEAARIEELKRFKKKHGHCQVSMGLDPSGGPLYHWIKRQRTHKNNGSIDPALEKQLDRIGFVCIAAPSPPASQTSAAKSKQSC